MKLLYQFLYLIYGFLFFRCPEKVFEQERNKNKKKLEETRITLALISSFAITDCLQKVNFEGFNLVILTYELQSAFLYFVM